MRPVPGTRRRRAGARARGLLVGGVLALGAGLASGCASGGASSAAPGGAGPDGAFESALEAGREEAAVEAFEADSTLHDDPAALYGAGLLYATPGSPVHDPGRARELLRRLLERHPDSGHRPAARAVLGLLQRADSLSSQLERLKAVDLDRPAADSTRRR